MFTKLLASGVALFAVTAGVAFAATQLSSSDGTQVCVSQASGLMRVASSCRAGEYPLTIGGGGSVQTTSGTSVVGWGSTATGTTLPLTGVTVAGKCEAQSTPQPGGETQDYGLARLLVTTSATMSAFSEQGFGVIDGSSLLTVPGAVGYGTFVGKGLGPTTLVVANGATATITFGAQSDPSARQCTYFWQAVESPNT